MNKPLERAASSEHQSRHSLAAIYDDKPRNYFGGARQDLVDLLETGPTAAVLELGCSAGGTGRAVLAAGKAARYVGLELSEEAAFLAAQVLSEVQVGDVLDMDLSAYEGQFDALVLSEVLEHLVDPWTVLRKLAACLKPGAQVVASSPNVGHWRVIIELFRGHFRYRNTGVMDRTHLRWFTPESFRELFESAGVEVRSINSKHNVRWKGRLFNAITRNRFEHLSMIQMIVVGRRTHQIV